MRSEVRSTLPARLAPSRRRLLFGGVVGTSLLAFGGGALAQAASTAAGAPGKPDAAPPKSAPTAPPEAAPAKMSVTLNAEQRTMLRQALSEAEQHGFGKAEFAPPEMDDLLKSSDPAELARGQAMLVSGVVAYARAQHGLRSFHGEGWPKEWAIRPQPYDAERDFAFAAHENKLEAWLSSLPPPFARYRALKDSLAQLRGEHDPAAAPAPAGRRSRKAATVAATAEVATQSPAKTSAKGTVSKEQRIAALTANMERWRWMPRNMPADRVEANSAGDLLQVYQGGQPTLAMKVAAGRPGDETPILTSTIESIVFNPAWHVPDSIASKELYPKNRRHPGYFKRNNFITVNGRLVQKPGAKNALGQIKFDFQNPFAVYLHDTPAQAAFDRASRNVSHGCVRVEKPIDLAALLLQGAPEGSPEAIQQVVAAEDTKRVQLPKGMPVFINYWTAFPGEGGEVEFHKDVYGWDTKLLQLLAAGRETA